MSKEIEIEYKTLLDEPVFHQLKKQYFDKEADAIQQTNYYFDTTDFALKKLGSGLRIRVKDGDHGELTLKTPLKEQAGLLETTDYLSDLHNNNLLEITKHWPNGEVIGKLNTYGIDKDQLELKASLTTARLEKTIAPGILLVLDESWYHGHHDFELEMEVQDATTGYPFFCDFLKEHHIAATHAPNKIARAVLANTGN